MAICGNLASYFSAAAGQKDLHWEYDFGMVTGSATAVFCYVVLVPLALYAWSWYRKLDNGYSYLEILSAYGYSLGVFVPVSMLWMVNFEWVRWALILGAVLTSGSVLFFTFWPLFSSDSNKLYGALAMGGVLGLHCLLAIGCKELFFHSGTVAPSPYPPTLDQTIGPNLALPTVPENPANPTQGAADIDIKENDGAKTEAVKMKRGGAKEMGGDQLKLPDPSKQEDKTEQVHQAKTHDKTVPTNTISTSPKLTGA